MMFARELLIITIRIVISIFVLLLLWCFFQIFILDVFVVSTSSMEPTIQIEDHVVVNKTIMGARLYSNLDFLPNGSKLSCFRTKGLRKLKHNDIIVFNYPIHKNKIKFVINKVYCKRVLGVPGDSLYIEEGRYVNTCFVGNLGNNIQQKLLNNTPDSVFPENVFHILPAGSTIKNMSPVYSPRKGDVVKLSADNLTFYKSILEWELGQDILIKNNHSITLADGTPLTHHQFTHNYYFVAGDNVLDSDDSRYWGLLPEEYIIGVVVWIF